ncbi:MAG: acyl-CoA dehydrogenase, partial [Pseudomonadota bacterium]
MTFAVEQEHTWNALNDEDFRGIIQSDFREHYPDDLRFPPCRLRWTELRDWYLRMSQKGWIAPNWPA